MWRTVFIRCSRWKPVLCHLFKTVCTLPVQADHVAPPTRLACGTRCKALSSSYSLFNFFKAVSLLFSCPALAPYLCKIFLFFPFPSCPKHGSGSLAKKSALWRFNGSDQWTRHNVNNKKLFLLLNKTCHRFNPQTQSPTSGPHL